MPGQATLPALWKKYVTSPLKKRKLQVLSSPPSSPVRSGSAPTHLSTVSAPTFDLSNPAPRRSTSAILKPNVSHDLDALERQYRVTSGFADLRCLIKLLTDPFWLEQETAKVLAELDSYGGGVGSTLQKLELEKTGVRVSVRSGEDGQRCLVRMRPNLNGRDIGYVSIHCQDCGVQHKWDLQRGALSAALIGRHGDNILDALLSGDEASHLCHNAICSDPFHILRELRPANIRRKRCVLLGRCVCGEAEPCRLDLTWLDGSKGWEKTYNECKQEQVAVPTPGWKCTKTCYVEKGKPIFGALTHWRKGCKRGGTFIRVFNGEAKISRERYDITR